MVDDCSFGLPKVGTWIVVVVGMHSHSPLIVGGIRTLMAVDVGPSLAVADTASAASLYSAGHSHVVVAIFNTMLDFKKKKGFFKGKSYIVRLSSFKLEAVTGAAPNIFVWII